jgi:hypothetical protein
VVLILNLIPIRFQKLRYSNLAQPDRKKIANKDPCGEEKAVGGKRPKLTLGLTAAWMDNLRDTS